MIAALGRGEDHLGPQKSNCGPTDQPRPLESVQIASVQTLHRRAIKAGTMELPEAGLVIVDECHHVIARSYRSIIERYPASILLGLTATPCRSEGRTDINPPLLEVCF